MLTWDAYPLLHVQVGDVVEEEKPENVVENVEEELEKEKIKYYLISQ